MDSANLPRSIQTFSSHNEILQKSHVSTPALVFDLLTFTRPSFKTEFIKHGDDVYLLVYLNSFSEYPFIRVPVSELQRSSLCFSRGAL